MDFREKSLVSVKNAFTQPGRNCSKYLSEKDNVFSWITWTRNRSVAWGKGHGAGHTIVLYQRTVQAWQPWCWWSLAHQTVPSKSCYHQVTPRCCSQPQSLHRLCHLQHLCSGVWPGVPCVAFWEPAPGTWHSYCKACGQPWLGPWSRSILMLGTR